MSRVGSRLQITVRCGELPLNLNHRAVIVESTDCKERVPYRIKNSHHFIYLPYSELLNLDFGEFLFLKSMYASNH